MDGDYLVPDKQIMREFSVSAMSIWRWTHDPNMNFPPPIVINNRNYRSRRAIESFKERLLAEAIQKKSVDPRITAMHDARRARRLDRETRKAGR